MRLTRKRIIAVFAAFTMLITLALPINTEAAAHDSQIKKLVKQMKNSEYSIIANNDVSDSKAKTIQLTNDSMARFAALSLPVKETDGLTKGEFGGYVTYKFSNARLKKASANIFGKVLSKKDITKKKQDHWVSDVFKTNKNGVVIYSTDGETETDYKLHKISIKKTGQSYKVTKNIYCGYWGSTSLGKSNYQVIYTVKPNSISSYGFKITGMKIKPIPNWDK